mmetsp:Transcript_5827/g.14936  ORF Transcript_5827/g.14936 Transcript_5827/m.14936 type:complete len:258 (-) Transcript_5827:392-1165(-)
MSVYHSLDAYDALCAPSRPHRRWPLGRTERAKPGSPDEPRGHDSSDASSTVVRAAKQLAAAAACAQARGHAGTPARRHAGCYARARWARWTPPRGCCGRCRAAATSSCDPAPSCASRSPMRPRCRAGRASGRASWATSATCPRRSRTSAAGPTCSSSSTPWPSPLTPRRIRTVGPPCASPSSCGRSGRQSRRPKRPRSARASRCSCPRSRSPRRSASRWLQSAWARCATASTNTTRPLTTSWANSSRARPSPLRTPR